MKKISIIKYSYSKFEKQLLLGVLQKLKEGAENLEHKIQAKVESLKNVNESEKGINLKFIIFNAILTSQCFCLFILS